MGATDNRVRDGGFTMVELVVVLAIIGIMAAIAIPAFTRMGLFSGNELQDSARQLYTLLRAAKIYAGTYGVDTALVYTTYNPEGVTPNNLRAAAIMYRHPHPNMWVDISGSRTQVFVPVSRADQGSFSPLPGETCLVSRDGTEDIPILIPEPGAMTDDYRPLIWDYPLTAHVFDPSGRLRNPAEMRERYTFRVGYTDDASPDERFVNGMDASGGLRGIDINLYRATGRVEISND